MKKLEPLLLLSIVLLAPSLTAAQNHEIDSLESALNTAKCDSVRFDVLTTICFKIVGIDSAKTEKYCSRLINEVETARDPVAKADGYAAIGDYYNSKLDFKNSFVYFQKAISIFRKSKGQHAEIEYAKCLTDYGYIFHINGDFNTALASYLEAENILDKYPEYDFREGLYNRIADIYSRINQPERMRYYNEKAEQISDKIVSPKLKALYYVNATYLLDYDKDFDKVQQLLNKAIMISEKNSLQEILWMATYSMGEALESKGDYEKAIGEDKIALGYARKIANKYDQACTITNIASVYMKQKKLGEAERQFVVALSLAKDIDASALEKDIYGSLSSVEALQGNYKKSSEYLGDREDAIYHVFSEEDQKQTNFLNAKYEFEKKETEIRRLTDQERIDALQIQRRELLAYLLSTLLLLSLVALYFIWRYYRSRRKIVEQENQIRQQKIKELESEKQIVAVQYALQGEEKERSRLARDLHDGLGGLLSGAKMAFGSFKEKYLNDGDEAESFAHALELLNKSIGELQRVAHNMMPQALINGNIKDAIEEFCDKMGAGGTMSIKFRFFGTEVRIGQNYEIAIYRIVQELVNNIMKHSGATEVLVQLVQEEGRVSLTVQDNGKGFDPEKIRGAEGHGLKNIRLRVESLSGRFDIDSTPGKGTEVSAEFENLGAV